MGHLHDSRPIHRQQYWNTVHLVLTNRKLGNPNIFNVRYIHDTALHPTIRELDSIVSIHVVLKGHTTRISHIPNPSYVNVPYQPYCLLMTGQKAVITVIFIREAFQRKIDIFYWKNTTLQCHSKCTCFFTASKRYESLPHDMSLISFKLIAWLRFIHTSTHSQA